MSEGLKGRTIKGKYHVTRHLGTGGGGTVFVARQLSEGRELGDVVLKFLKTSTALDPAACQRFITEARAARQVQSPYVVKIFDCDVDEQGQPFIAMEYVDGQPLSQRIAAGPMAPTLGLRVARQLCQALDACHSTGVLHRDLSSKNVLIQGDGDSATIKIIDFGLARIDGESITGSLSGTPRYMAPEQIRGWPLDLGVDIFSVGVLLYECFAGAAPIEARSSLEYLELNLKERPRSLRQLQPDLPPLLADLLECMMAKQRGERPADMQDVINRLGRIDVSQKTMSVDSGATMTCSLVAPALPKRPRRRTRRRPLALAALVIVGMILAWRGVIDVPPTAERTEPEPVVVSTPAAVADKQTKPPTARLPVGAQPAEKLSVVRPGRRFKPTSVVESSEQGEQGYGRPVGGL